MTRAHSSDRMAMALQRIGTEGIDAGKEPRYGNHSSSNYRTEYSSSFPINISISVINHGVCS